MSFTLSDLGTTIAKAAPLLGGVIAGPGGAAIGSLIAAKFGGNINKPEELNHLINADPEAAIKLKQIELDHELELQRLYIQAASEQAKGVLSDRASARQREAAVDSTPPVARDWTPAILAYMLTLGVFCALASLFCLPVPTGNQEVILGIVSSLTTVWVGAMGYYHGSSAGSRLKDIGLVNHLRAMRPPQADES